MNKISIKENFLEYPLKDNLVPPQYTHIHNLWTGEVVYSGNNVLEKKFLKHLFKHVKYQDKVFHKKNPDILLNSFESNHYIIYLNKVNNFCYDAKSYLQSSGSKIKFNDFICEWHQCQNLYKDYIKKLPPF